jgi:hypothetical protein
MESKQLDNLVRTGSLKHEPVIWAEYDGLVRSGRKRLTDAGNESLAFESRFDLAYNGAFSLALAALRWHGFRPENRYVVFQVIPHTLSLGPEVWRTLAECHRRRNSAEYEGFLEIDRQLLNDLFMAAGQVMTAVEALQRG